MSKAKKENPHYVNNAEFSTAVLDYVEECNEAKDRGEPEPIVTNYIASCFLKIAEGLSYKSNFIQYTFREEMVMDAVENCLKAIKNYDIDAATRTGKPNAFAYFTQISWYAFLRRITKEKRQYEIKMKYLFESGIEEFLIDESEDPESAKAVRTFIDGLRRKMEEGKEAPTEETETEEPIRQRRSRATPKADSDLMEFFEDED